MDVYKFVAKASEEGGVEPPITYTVLIQTKRETKRCRSTIKDAGPTLISKSKHSHKTIDKINKNLLGEGTELSYDRGNCHKSKYSCLLD